MKIHNTLGLPRALVNAATSWQPPQERREGADISVTDLVGPPRIFQLKNKVGHLVDVEAADRLWAMRGSAIHDYISRSADPGSISEKRLFGQWPGGKRVWTITGKPDLIEDCCLWDFKESAWNDDFKQGPKDDWTAQVNVYRALCKLAGIPVFEAKICVLIRDFRPMERYRVQGYPSHPAKVIPVPMWSEDSIEAYIQGRLVEHEKVMPECTADERWARSSHFAVTYEGAKKSSANYATLEEARFGLASRQEAMPKRIWKIEERQAMSVRCRGYCDVWEHCSRGREERGEEPLPEAP